MDEEIKKRFLSQFERLEGKVIYKEEEIDIWEEMLQSHDGVRLRTFFCRPKPEGVYPTIVVRSCYPNNEEMFVLRMQEFAKRGFAGVFQFCRGTGGSEGTWVPNVNDRADGLSLLNYLETLDFVGNVGYQGGSYLAFTGWVLADALPSKVKSLFLNIRNGITTLAYRNESPSRITYEPNSVVKISIKCWDIAWQLKKGSRLRLDISSSNFPEYAVHPNRAGIWSEISETITAEQTVWYGEGKASRVILGIKE